MHRRSSYLEQLILHMVGDYVLQTDRMAKRKTESSVWALAHAMTYSLPFFLLGSWRAVLVILLSHFLIDRFRLARCVVFVKNRITDSGLKWEDCKGTGYPKETPIWLAVWLMIAADNAVHLAINWACLRWL